MTLSRLSRAEKSKGEMSVSRGLDVFGLLHVGQVPENVEPMRVAGRDHQQTGAIGFWQFAQFVLRRDSRRLGTELVARTRSAASWCRRTVALQQDCGNGLLLGNRRRLPGYSFFLRRFLLREFPCRRLLGGGLFLGSRTLGGRLLLRRRGG